MSKLALDPINNLSSSTAPTLPTLRTGDVYFNTTTNQLNVYTGSAWIAIGTVNNQTNATIADTLMLGGM